VGRYDEAGLPEIEAQFSALEMAIEGLGLWRKTAPFASEGLIG